MYITVQSQKSYKPSTSRSTGFSNRQKPTIGSQVVIQSEQEKQLKKIFRKEDRRLARQQAKEGQQQTEDHLRNFDPTEMKRIRYEQWRWQAETETCLPFLQGAGAGDG